MTRTLIWQWRLRQWGLGHQHWRWRWRPSRECWGTVSGFSWQSLSKKISWQHLRVAVERLECTNICFLQVNSFNWIHQRVSCPCFWVHHKALQREGQWSYGSLLPWYHWCQINWQPLQACKVLLGRGCCDSGQSNVRCPHCLWGTEKNVKEGWVNCWSLWTSSKVKGNLQSSPAHNNGNSVHFYSTSLRTWSNIIEQEGKRPFQIINDCGFQTPMKTGRPEYCLPLVETVSWDVKGVFVKICQCIARMLQVYLAMIHVQ